MATKRRSTDLKPKKAIVKKSHFEVYKPKSCDKQLESNDEQLEIRLKKLHEGSKVIMSSYCSRICYMCERTYNIRTRDANDLECEREEDKLCKKCNNKFQLLLRKKL